MMIRVLALALMFCGFGEARADEGPYFIGDGDVADFALDATNPADARIYLTKKPTNEPMREAQVTLQPANGKSDIIFAPTNTPGVYVAKLDDLAVLPGQVLIQTSEDADAVSPVVPSYRQAQRPVASVPASSGSRPGMVWLFGGMIAVLAAFFVGVGLGRRASGARKMAGLMAIGLATGLTARKVEAHGGHDHVAPAADAGATGGDVVLPKRSQILIDLRTAATAKATVAGVMKAYGHVIPQPQLDATLTAPQAGFIRPAQGLGLGSKIRRGQVLGTLQAVNAIPIEAPIDGEISEMLAVPGSRVDAGAKLFRVTNMAVLWVDAELFSEQLVRLKDASSAQVAVDGVSTPIKARFLDAMTPVSEETRTAKVFLELISPPKALHVGALATVSIALGVGGEVVPVPAAAILDRGGDKIVFIQTGPETFAAREVSLRDGPDPSMALVTKGLGGGERVVVSGNYQLLMKAK